MKKAQVYIVIYSVYHHIYKLAVAMKEGVEATGLAECKIFRVAETLSPEILAKMRAPAPPDVPVITAAELTQADGILFGAPTRFGNVPAQMKALMDSCGQLWVKCVIASFNSTNSELTVPLSCRGELVGKLAGAFTSANTQHGGLETTIFSFLSFFTHLGMLFVPLGYVNPGINDTNVMNGGSPWGVSTICGSTGERQPSDLELRVAKTQGEYFAVYTAKMTNSVIG
ncbi:flavoprotein-like protein [Paraphysoderma sedebokerense]|nr:flavoprotein-like protein [Paraphysoderma sedebokerense]KAI9140778.1 flavoprotein-like protein [Paraphysoderma sedebokerense]